MPELRRESLHDAHLPLQYRGLIRKLDQFIGDSLQLRPRKSEAAPDELGALRRQHDELMSEALQFFRGEVSPTEERSENRDARLAFALGLYRCTFYEETVLGEVELVDTCGSQTLTHFEVDTAQGAGGRELVREFLAEELGFTADELNGLEAILEPELATLSERQQIVQALERRYSLNDTSRGDDAAWEMFSAMYPGHPFRPGEIDIIRTGTSVFYCIPFEGLALETAHWKDRSDAERQEVEEFLRHWSKFKQRYYAHFPAFGFFRGEDTAPELLRFLAGEVDVSEQEIADALTTMVSILQSSEIDKYIVHDAWGHQWQALLFRFEETYRSVARYDLLPAYDWRSSPDDESLESIVRLGLAEGIESAVDRWDDYFRSSLDHRLLRSLAGLVAEVLADVVEYKFILLEPDDAASLLSSSFFKDRPTKLDLTLWDLPWYFKIALKGFERFAERDDVRDEVCAELCERIGSDPEQTATVLAALARRTEELLDFEYRRSLHYEVEGEQIAVNAFCRVALNFLAMQAVFNDLYDQLREGDPAGRAGVRRFHDVLVFATASFFELDWYENFWLVDEFLGLHFPRLWKRLEG